MLYVKYNSIYKKKKKENKEKASCKVGKFMELTRDIAPVAIAV